MLTWKVLLFRRGEHLHEKAAEAEAARVLGGRAAGRQQQEEKDLFGRSEGHVPYALHDLWQNTLTWFAKGNIQSGPNSFQSYPCRAFHPDPALKPNQKKRG